MSTSFHASIHRRHAIDAALQRQRQLIPSPKMPQVPVTIERRSQAMMHALWSRDVDHEPASQTLTYIVRRATEDPGAQAIAPWRVKRSKIRAFRRVLATKLEDSIARENDPISKQYGYLPRFDEHYRDEFRYLLRELDLTYSDIVAWLDCESDIYGGHAGMGIVPWSHHQSVWFSHVMGKE